MSVVFSGTNQGSFTQVAGDPAKILVLRSDVDYLHVYNWTKASTPVGAEGIQFYWQRGLAADTGFQYAYNAGATAIMLTVITSGGFTLVDNTVNTPGQSRVITSINNATPPVVLAPNTAGLNNGDIIRVFNTVGALQLGGQDFTVGAVTTNTSFTLAFMDAIVTAAGPGTWRRIPYDPYFYPPTRVISKISGTVLSGSQAAIVTFTVTHHYTVGQKLRFKIPTVTALAFGMTELNDVEATILAIGAADADGVTNTVTVDVDVTAFTAFAWPLTADGSFTPAHVVPVGENTSRALAAGVNEFGDSEINLGFIGISLAGGVNSPAGESGDIIYWVAGKSFNI